MTDKIRLVERVSCSSVFFMADSIRLHFVTVCNSVVSGRHFPLCIHVLTFVVGPLLLLFVCFCRWIDFVKLFFHIKKKLIVGISVSVVCWFLCVVFVHHLPSSDVRRI